MVMLIPPGYRDRASYFSDALSFLRDHSWVYNFPVTELLVQDVFQHLPRDWSEALLALSNAELNGLPRGFMKSDWPPSLVHFCRQCQLLRLPVQMADRELCQMPEKMRRGLTPKKQHEVTRLAALVHAECSSPGVSHVLDVGAGLGYLGQLLHNWYGYWVLGLELKAERVKTASERQLSLCRSAAVKHVAWDVSADSNHSVGTAIQDHARCSHDCGCGAPAQECTSSCCVIGLHTCGDLTVDTMRLFLQLGSARLLVVVPCCYHKMRLSRHSPLEEEFCSFPLSTSLHQLLDSTTFLGSQKYLRRPFLRLASQETATRWEEWSEEEHRHHSLQVMARAVLQLWAHNDGLILKKRRRRAVRKTNRSTFESFLDDALARYEVIGARDRGQSRVTELWHQHEPLCQLSEVMTALQVAVQGVAESLVLADQAAYLQEQGSCSVEIMKVMDDGVSPRCLALVARKENM